MNDAKISINQNNYLDVIIPIKRKNMFCAEQLFLCLYYYYLYNFFKKKFIYYVTFFYDNCVSVIIITDNLK